MARDDLLALSLDDLAKLSNRGKATAARKELDDGRLRGELSESPEGAVSVRWADGRTTEVPAGAALGKGRCWCQELGVCKHLVALALLYQSKAAASARYAGASGPWDPGAIPDDELAGHFRGPDLARARQRFDEGILAELVRATQPLARFHLPVCTVRFLVPGSPAYAKCNCAQPAPCEHVALAVWAFRLLPSGQRAGIVTAGAAAPAVPAELLDAIEVGLLEFAEQGVSGSAKGALDGLTRLAKRCEEEDLIWPAEVIGEWLGQLECYQGHDARFDPARVAALVGELAGRADALRARAAALPPLLVRGGAADRAVKVEGGEYWGLGCAVRPGRRGVEVVAYLYDRKSAQVVALVDEVAQSEADSFGVLAERVAVPGLADSSFRAVGAGVLQLAGGRRTARHVLKPGRARQGRRGMALLVQDRLAWEEIEPPVFVEDFGDLRERLGVLPPSCLRARRVADDFHVLRIARLEEARFDQASHTVRAIVTDAAGHRALLEHPYLTRGRAGVEALLGRLGAGPGELRFVAGNVRQAPGGLVVRPTGLVWQEGERRTLLQPWIERDGAAGAGQGGEMPPLAADAASEFLEDLSEQLGEVLVLGLTRIDIGTTRAWGELGRRGEAVGFARLSARINELAERLEKKAHTLAWDARGAAAVLLELAVLARLAQDVG